MRELPSLKQQLSELIALPSVSCTDAAWDMPNRAVIERLAEWFSALGFVCEIMDVQPGKANLIATLGKGEGGLVFAGHTDTVPYDKTGWQSDPFTLTERDDKWYGLGSCDMKGFFPLILEAVKDFKAEEFSAPLIVLATCDEECSMSGARALVAASKPKARFAVIGEPTSMKPLRMHKGVMMERVRLDGRSGHSSDPSLGANALEAMNEVMSALMAYRGRLQQAYRHEAFHVPVPTLNLGCIHGGDNPNRICAQCELQFDLRPLPGMDMEALRHDIRGLIKPIAERFQVQWEYAPLFAGTPAMETSATSPLVQSLERLTGVAASAAAFGTEAPFFQELGMDVVIYGPGGIEQAHQPNEYLSMAAITPTVTVLKQLIREHCIS